MFNLEKIIVNFWDKHISSWVIPLMSLIFTSSGVLMGLSNLNYLSHRYPNWSHQINIILHDSPIVFISSGTIWFLLYVIDQKWFRKSLMELENQLDKANKKNGIIALNIQNILLVHLSEILKKLELNNENSNTERISLYMHDGNKNFFCLERHSFNPLFQKKSRLDYPDHQGCLGKAWQDDWHLENVLDSSNIDEYVKVSGQKYSLTKKTVNELTMKSNFYAAKRINTNEIGKKPIGVLILESTDREKFMDKDVKKY